MSEPANQSRLPSASLEEVRLASIKTYEKKQECYFDVTTLSRNKQLKMPSCESAEKAFSLIKTDKSKILGLQVGKHNVTPGQQIPKADAQAPPGLSFDASTGIFLAICLDLDAPFASLAVLSPVLHWIQPGFKPQAGTSNLRTEAPFVADYAGPGPPPVSGPHRYVFLLYEQPADFDGSKYAPAEGKGLGLKGRVRYNLAAFERKSKLGEVAAANWFCSN